MKRCIVAVLLTLATGVVCQAEFEISDFEPAPLIGRKSLDAGMALVVSSERSIKDVDNTIQGYRANAHVPLRSNTNLSIRVSFLHWAMSGQASNYRGLKGFSEVSESRTWVSVGPRYTFLLKESIRPYVAVQGGLYNREIDWTSKLLSDSSSNAELFLDMQSGAEINVGRDQIVDIMCDLMVEGSDLDFRAEGKWTRRVTEQFSYSGALNYKIGDQALSLIAGLGYAF